jgi:hypothetical protein
VGNKAATWKPKEAFPAWHWPVDVARFAGETEPRSAEMIVPLRYGRSAIDLDRARTPLAREDLKGHEEKSRQLRRTPLHIFGEAWSTNQAG